MTITITTNKIKEFIIKEQIQIKTEQLKLTKENNDQLFHEWYLDHCVFLLA